MFKFRQRHFRLRTFLDFLRKCNFPNPTPFATCIIIFETSDLSPNQHFLKKSTSYVASAQSTRTKMTAIWFSSYELFVKMDTFELTLRLNVSIFCEKALFHFEPFKYCLQRTLCSDFRSQLLFLFYENRPAKTQFQISPFSTTTRSEKSRTPPDRSATPYYVESFRFQPGFIERKLKILKVLS